MGPACVQVGGPRALDLKGRACVCMRVRVCMYVCLRTWAPACMFVGGRPAYCADKEGQVRTHTHTHTPLAACRLSLRNHELVRAYWPLMSHLREVEARCEVLQAERSRAAEERARLVEQVGGCRGLASASG